MGMYVNKITKISNLIISVQLFVEKLWAKNRQIHRLQISFLLGEAQKVRSCVSSRKVWCKKIQIVIFLYLYIIFMKKCSL